MTETVRTACPKCWVAIGVARNAKLTCDTCGFGKPHPTRIPPQTSRIGVGPRPRIITVAGMVGFVIGGMLAAGSILLLLWLMRSLALEGFPLGGPFSGLAQAAIVVMLVFVALLGGLAFLQFKIAIHILKGDARAQVGQIVLTVVAVIQLLPWYQEGGLLVIACLTPSLFLLVAMVIRPSRAWFAKNTLARKTAERAQAS